ncbi:DEAD-domain-containing protein [Basidiobolus meristosporus CBS 931.73]|uniref:ATP-dependent RNA helicase n=1 Tax=Basidiobolus meristosporus CBS 931.73 TaxID=1314790 RepID=A0A1Y1XMX4_9FUNG|nr:DEAD-domain-containing protein [Basidiobolus meristosporus CBS 931.73]|eukprot:ORX87088.1 DEAD-domain-containing protein [Basidiobolus meristosporus CBS 931.73]
MSKVQDAVLSKLPITQDLFVKAKTGTGKTLGFLIPAIETALRNNDVRDLKTGKRVSVFIMSPTRELALQIAEEAEKLLSFYPFQAHCFVGGTSKGLNKKIISTRRVDFIIATPGRALDLLSENTIFQKQIEGTKLVILDEADQLLEMGFRDTITDILNRFPKERQTFMFSATVSPQIRKIAHLALKPDHIFLDTVDPNDVNTNLKVKQSYVVAPLTSQLHYLRSILEKHRETQSQGGKIIVFCPTTRTTALFASAFEAMGYPIYELHSRMDQSKRIKIAQRFKKSPNGILFTSDVSARGVDYPGVSLVVQAGTPTSREQYIHRVGRTGRAGKDGEGVLLLAPYESGFLKGVSDLPIEKSTEFTPIAESPETDKAVNKALRLVDPVLIEDSYRAHLGYLTSRAQDLRFPKSETLPIANDFYKGFGVEEPPHVSESFLSKLGLLGKRDKFSKRGGHFGGSFRSRDDRLVADRYSNDNGYERRPRGRDFQRSNTSSYGRPSNDQGRRSWHERGSRGSREHNADRMDRMRRESRDQHQY